MYHYAGNNPVKYTDPDGRNSYFIIWASSDESVGHAGFAVDNYDDNGNADGTITYYDLWPGNEGGVGASNVTKDVEAYYGTYIYSKEDLLSCDLSTGEGTNPDGVLEFATDKNTDDKTKQNLESFMLSSNVYNGKSRNCSDMAKVGVKSSKKGVKLFLGTEHCLIFSFTTPNKLFTDSKKYKNASVLLDPGTKTDFCFSNNYVAPGIKQYISNLWR